MLKNKPSVAYKIVAYKKSVYVNNDTPKSVYTFFSYKKQLYKKLGSASQKIKKLEGWNFLI